MGKVIIIKGVSIALGISIFLLAVVFFQALLDPQPVNYLSAYSRYFTAISLLVGGFYAGHQWLKKGWLAGGSVGFMYCLVGLICSLILIPRMLTILDLFNALVPGTVLAGMAGVCGVNIGRAQARQSKASRIQRKKQVGRKLV